MSIKRIWMDGDTMRVDEISGEAFARRPKEASMTDNIYTSKLARIDLASGQSPVSIEECVSTWAVDDRIQSLIADNERLRGALHHWDSQALAWLGSRAIKAQPGWMVPAIRNGREALGEPFPAALSHKDMGRG